jgi:DNA-binding XRE family transcriptional regulator
MGAALALRAGRDYATGAPAMPAVSKGAGISTTSDFALPRNITGGNVSPRRLATVIRKLRDAEGLTQEELAKKAGVTQSYIAQLESGLKKNPSLPTLKKLARALGVPVTELLE